MLINNIEITNFQSYYDTSSMDFGKGLNLIIGNGGKGKSKLFNAFYWVLFGKIYITSEGWRKTDELPAYTNRTKSIKRQEYMNKKALHDAKPGERVLCSVILELVDDKGQNYTISRSAHAERKDSDSWDKDIAWTVSNNDLKITYDSPTGTEVKVGDLAEIIISNLFPEGIRGYIWFQGESLDDLIDFSKEENLKDAVNHISYYPYYEKLSKIISCAKGKIEKIESRKLKELNKHNTDFRNLMFNLENQRTRLENAKKDKAIIENRISIIQVALAEDEGKVRGLARFTSLVKKYDDCEREISQINDQLTMLDDRQRELLPSLWILRGIDSLIEDSKRIISSHVEEECTAPERKYLDNPSRVKLEEILRDHRCYVCGSHVDDEHPDAVEWIKDRIQKQEEFLKEMEDYTTNLELSKQFNMFVGKIQDYPDLLLISLKNIDKQYQRIEEEIEKLMARRHKLHEVKEGLDKEIEEVKHRFGVDPHKEAAQLPNLDNDIRISRSNLEKQQRLLKANDEAILQTTASIRATEKEITGMNNTAGIVTEVEETKWKEITVFLERICKRVQENAREDLLRKIEKRSNQFYDKFTEHDLGYKGKIEIGDDYTIKFDTGLNTSHEDRKKMSIINALLSLNQEAIGTYYPFISDAPTSSFDPSTTHKYLMGIKDIFDQAIIMTKDVEVDSDNYQDLYSQSKVSRIYQLNSKLYTDSKEPEIYEVSSEIKRLK